MIAVACAAGVVADDTDRSCDTRKAARSLDRYAIFARRHGVVVVTMRIVMRTTWHAGRNTLRT